MANFVIRPLDVFHIIRRQKKIILRVFAGTIAVYAFLFLVVPRSYQSETIVHIGVNYFQNPLIGDLISQTHDPGELRSERQKILESSLGVEFANRMGEKYHLFRSAPTDVGRAVEVEWFLKSIQISSVTPTQFKITYRARTAATADGVIRDAIASVREYMYRNRVEMLEQFLLVLSNEIVRTTDDSSAKPLVSAARAENAKMQISNQIGDLEKRLEELRRNYSEQHPSIAAVRNEISELRSLEKGGGLAPTMTRRSVFQKGPSGLGAMTIRDDLSKQKHLVNISLEMERKDPTMAAYVSLTKEPVLPKSAAFPKLRLFLLFAMVSGMIFSSLAAAVREFWERSDQTPKDIAAKLKVPRFGPVVLSEGVDAS